MLNQEYIAPFIKSIQNVFSMMLQLDVQIGEPYIKADMKASCDISGIIGLSGDISGSAVLSFPFVTSERIVALFTGKQLDIDDPDFADAVGELINIISGNAKAEFKNRTISISTPSVVVGSGHHVTRPKDIPCVAIPCCTDCGELVMEISLKDNLTECPEGVQSSVAMG